jgi:hypothetical protein
MAMACLQKLAMEEDVIVGPGRTGRIRAAAGLARVSDRASTALALKAAKAARVGEVLGDMCNSSRAAAFDGLHGRSRDRSFEEVL